MSKWLWYAASAALVGLGGLGYYAYRQPESLVGQAVIRVGEFGLQVNPVTNLTRQILTAKCQNETLGPGRGEPCPAEAKPVEEQAPAGQPLAGAVDLRQTEEQGEILPVASSTPSAEASSWLLDPPPAREESGPLQIAQVPETEQHGPGVMPYSPEEGDDKAMPYAPDASEDPYDPANLKKPATADSSQALTCLRLLFPLLDAFIPREQPDAQCQGLPDSSAMGGMESQQCQNEHSGHMVCPYSGKCVQPNPSCESTQESQSPTEQLELIAAPTPLEPEGKEPEAAETVCPAKKTRKPIRRQSRYTPSWPLAPYIDTMEYRSSDKNLNETGPGPF